MVKILLILFVYVGLFEKIVPTLAYLDELITIICLLLVIVKISLNSNAKNYSFTKLEIIILSFSFMLLVTGILSTYYSDISNTIYMQVYTIFAAFKFLIIFFSLRILLADLTEERLLSVGKFALSQTYFFTALFILLLVFNMFFGVFEVYSFRFGINSISYGYSHPAVFSSIVLIQSIINLYFNAKYHKKIDLVYIILNLILLISAGRFTAIGFFVMSVVLLYTYRYFKKYVSAGIIIGFTLMILVGFNRIVETFISSTGARGILLNTAIKIAQDYFPLGSGLATFGSHASRINYSEIYHLYGISNIYGFSQTSNFYITDSYWAMIIGEYGFIGAGLWGGLFIFLFINSYITGKGVFGYLISLPILYLLISSPIDTIIVSSSIVPYMFLLVLILTFEKKFSGNHSLIKFKL